MNRTLRKTLRREIRNTFPRFLSILIMVALGTLFLVGLRSAAPDMRKTADRYFDDHQFMDVQVLSTLGLTDEDIAAFQAVPGVETAEGGWSLDGIVTLDERECMVKAISLSENEINSVKVLEGTLPTEANECAVEPKLIETFGVTLGDEIPISLGTADGLNAERFTVTAVVESPLYISIDRGTGSLGDGSVDAYVMLPKASFALDYYTLCNVIAEGAREKDAYSQDYENQMEALKDALRETAEERGQLRYETLVSEAESSAEDAQQALDTAKSEGEAEILAAETELNAARATLDEGWNALDEAKAEYDLLADYGESELLATMASAIEENQQELLNGEEAYEEGLAALEDARRELEERLREGQTEIDEARGKIEDIQPAQIFTLDRNTNYGFASYAQNADRMANLAKMFPVIFFLVAALVCLTTMTRMVEEERTEIGSIKAMGYGTAAIAGKFLGYGAMAALLGGVMGVAIGTTLIPWVIYTSYGIMYHLPNLHLELYWPLSLASVGAGLACVVGATLFAMLGAARETPAALMRPKAPKAGKRILLEHLPFLWKRLRFSVKVSCRNLFRYKKRLIMTVIGIAGCTALMIAGLGLRNSIFGIIQRQYGDIYTYDLEAAIETTDKAEIAQLRQLLDETENVSQTAPACIHSVTAQADAAVDSYLFVTDDPEAVYGMIDLRSMSDGSHVNLTGEGVVIDQKLSELLGVQVGDEIVIDAGKLATAKVTGIVEHYVRHYVYMTSELYEEIFQEAYTPNEFLIQAEDESDEAISTLAETLLSQEEFPSVSNTAAAGRAFRDTLETINAAVMIIILSAAALALVVLYNLTNINITERIRELATIKVLGFYDGEVAMYIYRENIVLTFLGILFGACLGKYLRAFLVGTIELDIVMFGRTAEPSEYVIAILLSLLFALLVNVLMFFRMKKINMIESLKSVE